VAELRAQSAAPGEFYDIENSLLADYRVIPLFYLPEFFAVSSRVENWTLSPAGDSRPQAVWLETEKP
jgi:ABC-type transport system substrate-binding protein